jgi:hypothetical protein
VVARAAPPGELFIKLEHLRRWPGNVVPWIRQRWSDEDWAALRGAVNREH